MANVYTLFKKLLPSKLMQAGEVTAFDSYSATVALPTAAAVTAGTGKSVKVSLAGNTVAVGDRVFIQGGEIVGVAPSLTMHEVTV